MGLIDRIRKRLVSRPYIEVTPELLGHLLILKAGHHLADLYKLKEKDDILHQMNELKELAIFQELFIFYFSLLSFSPLFDEMTASEASVFGGLFLAEAFKALGNSEFPTHIKESMVGNDLFREVFDEDFRFYYHDQIPENEVEDLQRIKGILKCEKVDWQNDPLGSLTVKLHYRLCQILVILPEKDFQSFFALYYLNSACVISFCDNTWKKLRVANVNAQKR